MGATPATSPVSLRLVPYAIAFVAGFPGLIGALALFAEASRGGIPGGSFPLAGMLLASAAALLVLGLSSRLVVGPDGVTVRFFGLRSTTVAFKELTAATFFMTFPSISFALKLVDRAGRKAVLHANWWRGEDVMLATVAKALVAFDVPMDRSTARVVSRTLRVKRPKARIIHHALLRKDRTW